MMQWNENSDTCIAYKSCVGLPRRDFQQRDTSSQSTTLCGRNILPNSKEPLSVRMHSSNRTCSYLVNAHCDVAEDNRRDREHYESEWLEMRPRGKITLSEHDTVKKESYEQELVTNFRVQRFPEQKIGVGRQGEMSNQLPYKNVLPMPLFLPRKAVPFKGSEHTYSPAESRPIMEFEQPLSSGVCRDKQAVSQITKGLPKVINPMGNSTGSFQAPQLGRSARIQRKPW